MRFDYQPPTLRLKSFRNRRLFNLFLVLTGLGLITFALLTSSPSNKKLEDSVDTKRPILFAQNNISPVLSLGHTATPTKQQASSINVNTIVEQAIELANNTHITSQDRWHTITVQVGDTLAKVFDKLGVPINTLHNIMRNGPDKSELYNIYPGQTLDFLVDESKQLKELKFTLSNTKSLHVAQTDAGFKYHYEETEPSKKSKYLSAKIRGSLYATAQNIGLDDRIIMQMADIFGCDIDFNLDIRDNDSFKVLFEEEYIRDQKIGTGKVLAVEFNNQGRIYKAIRYTNDQGHSGYFTPDGYSLQKAFLRSPVVFTRISSHFSNARKHPILHKIRSHKGVDYAAPSGTPVKSAADGRITFIGNKGGYGKSIEVTHGQKYSTFYAHLSKFPKKLRYGTTVKQGQVIGFVGKTGLATGAHLHYEFRINGVHHNPVTVSLPRSISIASKYKSQFNVQARDMLAQLNSHSKLAHND